MTRSPTSTNFPKIHHSQLVADVPYQTQVMRYEQEAQSEFFFQLEQKLYDLGLNRDIQGGYDFIAYDEFRL